jgi:hypothetical protein
MKAARHRRIAERNERLFKHLRERGKWSDWAETALFYAAHHEVMALLTEHGIVLKETKHGEMTRTLREKGWPEMARIHGALLGRSYRARYFGGESKDEALQDSYEQFLELRKLIAAVPEPSDIANPS